MTARIIELAQAVADRLEDGLTLSDTFDVSVSSRPFVDPSEIQGLKLIVAPAARSSEVISRTEYEFTNLIDIGFFAPKGDGSGLDTLIEDSELIAKHMRLSQLEGVGLLRRVEQGAPLFDVDKWDSGSLFLSRIRVTIMELGT